MSVFPLMGKAAGKGNPACRWLGLYFCLVWCLGAGAAGVGDAGSCVQAVSSV